MFLLVVLCFVLASGEPLVSRRAVKRLSERVQAASGANANGVPVEFGLAALLRGEAEGVLEKSLFPAIEGLRKEAKALQQRYAKDTPLPAPTALRTMPRPMAEEPLKTLMELLSPEFPVFLGGTPFSFSTARAAVQLDRSPEAMDDARLAVADFQDHCRQVLENATKIAAERRTQILKRHILEREQLFAVDATAAVLETMRMWEFERGRTIDVENHIKELEEQEAVLRNQTDKQLKEAEEDSKSLGPEGQAQYQQTLKIEMDRRANFTATIAAMRAKEAADTLEGQRETTKHASLRAGIRAASSTALESMQKKELEFFDAVSAAVLQILRAKLAVDTEGLAQVMWSVTHVINSVKPMRNDSVECLLQANTWLAEVYDLNEDESTFFTVTAAMSGAVSVAVEQTMRVMMEDILNLAQPSTSNVTLNVTGNVTLPPVVALTDEGQLMVQSVFNLITRATSELQLLLDSSRIIQMADKIGVPTTTTTRRATTKEPTVPLEDRSPAWLRRRAFIERVRLMKQWRNSTTMPGATTTTRFGQTTTTTKATTTSSGQTTVTGPTHPLLTEAPLSVSANASAAARQVRALAMRLKGFAEGLAEFDAARVAFKKGDKEHGVEFLANAFDDLKIFDNVDALSDLRDGGDDDKLNEHLMLARKLLALRVARVHGHLQVSSFLRNEGTEGYNFYGNAQEVARDIFSRADTVSANMEHVISNFKTADDIIENADAVGILMGGKVGKRMRQLKVDVEQFRIDHAGLSDVFAVQGPNIARSIESVQKTLLASRNEYQAKVKTFLNAKDEDIDEY